MIGISTFCTAFRNSRPIPGHWNTLSVISANAMIEPSCRPVMVITGTSVFFSAWPKLIARLDKTRARELDVVGAQHLHHLAAHQPHDQRHLEQAERDCRQHQRLQSRRGEKAGGPEADAHDFAAPAR